MISLLVLFATLIAIIFSAPSQALTAWGPNDAPPFNVITISTGSAYTVQSLNALETNILWNSNSGLAKTLTLKGCTSADKGLVVVVKDQYGDASSHAITITPSSGTINSSSTASLSSNNNTVSLVCDGTSNWVMHTSLNGTLPGVLGSVLSNLDGQRFYARNYGSCTWDATHDVVPCINLAVAAAYNSGNVLGKVVVPAGTYGAATNLLQSTTRGVDIIGAGGNGGFGFGPTTLKWIGAAGGTMAQFGDGISNTIVQGGFKDLVFDCNDSAAKGVVERSHIVGTFENVGVGHCTSRAWDIDATSLGGNSDIDYYAINLFEDTAASSAGTCLYIGDGTATKDTFQSRWYGLHCQYQNAIGVDIGNSDKLTFYDATIQPVGAGPWQNGLKCRAGSVAGTSCRALRFSGAVGGAGHPETAPLFKNGTDPSRDNIAFFNQESGEPNPSVDSGARITYNTSKGIFASTNSNSSAYYGGTAAAFNNGAVFDFDVANSTNFATEAKFGPTLPIYLHYNQPLIGFNEAWGGSNWVFGKGSVSGTNYGGKQGFDTTTGSHFFTSTTATGNASAAATDLTTFVVDRLGNAAPTAALQLKAVTAATVLAITCNGAAEGKMYGVTDANSAVFNAAVAAGGANHMIAYCDGTSWKIR